MNTPLFSLLLLLSAYRTTGKDVVLTEELMKLSETAAELSVLAFQDENAPFEDAFTFFNDEPDQALVAAKDGRCFVAFRGTIRTFRDWQQNFTLRTKQVCNGQECCRVRKGFYQAYNTKYHPYLEDSIRSCVEDSCDKEDADCVVLTGHSQGGAVASIAAMYLSDLNPFVITFGSPPAIFDPCPLILQSSSRWYRYVNTKAAKILRFGIAYDPVPFSIPGVGRADHFGHLIILSDDNTGVASIGPDAQDYFGPPNVNGFEAHRMVKANGSSNPGYLDRIRDIIRQYDSSTDGRYQYPVRTSGYVAGSMCTNDKECDSGNCERETGFSYRKCVGSECRGDGDCAMTGRCDSGLCAAKLSSCQRCNEHKDCLSEKCTWRFRCTGQDGLMDDQCACNFDSDCRSGRCEGVVKSRCKAKLPLGARCNESSDCASGRCSWKFKCS